MICRIGALASIASAILFFTVNVAAHSPNPADYAKLIENDNSLADLTILTPAQADAYFQRFLLDPKLPFIVPEDGCYARAHYMAKALELEGVITAKAFVFGDLGVGSNYSPKCIVHWNYHVAPVMKVRVGNDVQLQILDPATLERPRTFEHWVLRIGTPERTEVYFSKRFAYGDRDLKGVPAWDPNDDILMHEDLQRMMKIQEQRLELSPGGIRCEYPEP